MGAGVSYLPLVTAPRLEGGPVIVARLSRRRFLFRAERLHSGPDPRGSVPRRLIRVGLSRISDETGMAVVSAAPGGLGRMPPNLRRPVALAGSYARRDLLGASLEPISSRPVADQRSRLVNIDRVGCEPDLSRLRHPGITALRFGGGLGSSLRGGNRSGGATAQLDNGRDRGAKLAASPTLWSRIRDRRATHPLAAPFLVCAGLGNRTAAAGPRVDDCQPARPAFNCGFDSAHRDLIDRSRMELPTAFGLAAALAGEDFLLDISGTDTDDASGAEDRTGISRVGGANLCHGHDRGCARGLVWVLQSG